MILPLMATHSTWHVAKDTCHVNRKLSSGMLGTICRLFWAILLPRRSRNAHAAAIERMVLPILQFQTNHIWNTDSVRIERLYLK